MPAIGRRQWGRRDYAVLMILAKLGLRASEVATLNLDDIDWQAGTILVHGKGRRQATMPLRHDVGMGAQPRHVGEFSCEHLRRMWALPPAAPSR
ncbi:tyrosine-type recombinase/integrase [Rhizobium leguminosarum]|uniref:tyrosine-type recombinase/integrase n=1 Tax=Rhizobium leguminosarum TaxID=384 RepID=UPI0028A665F8|nr:tyrosine-type recombinase/integrase [Rhizobium leguminosarum]